MTFLQDTEVIKTTKGVPDQTASSNSKLHACLHIKKHPEDQISQHWWWNVPVSQPGRWCEQTTWFIQIQQMRLLKHLPLRMLPARCLTSLLGVAIQLRDPGQQSNQLQNPNAFSLRRTVRHVRLSQSCDLSQQSPQKTQTAATVKPLTPCGSFGLTILQ